MVVIQKFYVVLICLKISVKMGNEVCITVAVGGGD